LSKPLQLLRSVPAYLWSFLALLAGIALGGWLPETLQPVARGTRAVLSFIVTIAPLLILGALTPAVASLIRRGLAGRFVFAVLFWFVAASTAGSFLGMLIAALLFRLPLLPDAGALFDGAAMLGDLRSGSKAFNAIVVIGLSVVIGLIGARFDRVNVVLRKIERGIARAGASIGVVMIPLVLALGIMIGVNFGARLGMSHYGLLIAYAAGLTTVWWIIYFALVLPYIGHIRDRLTLVKEYFLPTALFAAGTCSSLATIPLNIAHAKKYGTRDEVADFVIPLGAVVHKGASAMHYMAYGPFIAGYVFGIDIGWEHLLAVWPIVVIYTMASPGVPGAMGLSLWTAILFAGLLGLQDPERTTFIGTWVALAGGIPDMFRTAGNATADGFAAVIFSRNFDRWFGARERVPGATAAIHTSLPQPQIFERRTNASET